MNALVVSRRDRFVSRVCFYLLVAALLWAADWTATPDRAEERYWTELGVAAPWIAVPVSELPPWLR